MKRSEAKELTERSQLNIEQKHYEHCLKEIAARAAEGCSSSSLQYLQDPMYAIRNIPGLLQRLKDLGYTIVTRDPNFPWESIVKWD